MGPRKRLVWLGSSKVDLKGFPPAAVADLGYQLFLVQCGQEPRDWKPMPTVGAAVRELRVRDRAGAFRTLYVANRPGAIYILHCFQKKTQQTAEADIDLARRRLAALPKG